MAMRPAQRRAAVRVEEEQSHLDGLLAERT
jgi:hypothetical protein